MADPSFACEFGVPAVFPVARRSTIVAIRTKESSNGVAACVVAAADTCAMVGGVVCPVMEEMWL